MNRLTNGIFMTATWLVAQWTFEKRRQLMDTHTDRNSANFTNPYANH